MQYKQDELEKEYEKRLYQFEEFRKDKKLYCNIPGFGHILDYLLKEFAKLQLQINDLKSEDKKQ